MNLHPQIQNSQGTFTSKATTSVLENNFQSSRIDSQIEANMDIYDDSHKADQISILSDILENKNTEESQKNSMKPIDIRKTKIRFFVLFLASIFIVGNYFSYDNPSVIEKEIEKTLGID